MAWQKILWNLLDELKKIFVDSVRQAKEIGHLSTSQIQTIIMLIEKKKKLEIKDS